MSRFLLRYINSQPVVIKASELCRQVMAGCTMSFGRRKIYKSRGFETEITVAKSPKDAIVLLAHSPNIKNPTLAYRQRWSIESGFKAMKSGGFNMNHTHLTKPKRICTLFKIIAILTSLTLKLGILMDQKLPIKIKKHGRKARSFIRYAISLLIKPRTRDSTIVYNVKKTLKSILISANLENNFELCRVL